VRWHYGGSFLVGRGIVEFDGLVCGFVGLLKSVLDLGEGRGGTV